ncbi:beta-phosphoglucomutase [Natronincola peptidivorans]|uniref:Beta-phosphoglucomutase n=1 Tax=Natronincola peptidivorans TaxID=426128 RepID=A0A1I0A7A7_9FIRM|nr:beta-phosphoglucomutase [Natronincola peptidivorans]SES89568.1 beta-phosphoglucomutase [Natronincola peptidivorans]
MLLGIEGYIFDLDGVIVDTAKYHYSAWKKLAHRLGFDFQEDENERLKGVSRTRALEILLDIGGIKAINPEEKRALADLKNSWYQEYILRMETSEILPGVLPFLRELRKRTIKIALGSASKNAVTILDKLNLMAYFDVIVDGNKVTKAKPDPEVFLLAAKLLNLSPEKCIVFEDAFSGIEAAKSAGMYAVGIGSPQVLYQADLVFPSLEKITIDSIEKALSL